MRLSVHLLLLLFLQPTILFAESFDHISVVYCRDIEPFEYTDKDGKANGLIIDYWKLWSKKTGVTVHFIEAAWDQTLTMVKDGKTDVHAGLFFNEERSQYLEYGGILSKTDTHIFSHESIRIPDNISELSSYRIGVIAKDFVEGYLKDRVEPSAVIGYPDYQSLMADLQSGKLKVFAADTPTGLFHLSAYNLLTKFRYSKSTPLYQNNWYFASSKGRTELIAVLNAGMEKITAEERKHIARRWISGHPVDIEGLVIAISSNYPPFSTIGTDGQPRGYLIDIWKEWSRHTGEDIWFRPSSWVDGIAAVKSGEADIHSGLFTSAERETWLSFSQALFPIETALYYKTGTQARNLNELDGQNVAVLLGSYQEGYLRQKYPSIQIVTCTDIDDMLIALVQEKIVAVLTEKPEMESTLHRFGVQGAIQEYNVLFSNDVHAAVLNGNENLLAIINKGFAGISTEQYADIKNRWFKEERNWTFRFYWIVGVASIFLLISAIVLFRNRVLGREIKKRNLVQQALISSKLQAEAANTAKSEFLANMSHEIRTPMNAIIGMTNLAIKISHDKQQTHYLTTVQESADGLLALLNDILDFSKIEAGQLDLTEQSIDLAAVLKRCNRVVRSGANEKHIALFCWLDFALSTQVQCDELRLRQVLLNLLSNAVKFTKKGHVFLNVQLKQETTHMVTLCFSVQDSGIGISIEQQKCIFDNFSQADASITRKYGGTGLGLTISQKLVELMGGELSVTSREGEGSRFQFTLDLKKGNHIHQEQVVTSNYTSKRILLVHPISVYRQLLQQHLESIGVSVCSTGSIQQAQAHLQESNERGTQFDLIIMEQGDDSTDAQSIFNFLKKYAMQTLVVLMMDMQNSIFCSECNDLPLSTCLIYPFSNKQFQQAVLDGLRHKKCLGPQLSVLENAVTSDTLPPSLSVLVVEDNAANMDLARILLEQKGHKVIPAENGMLALETLTDRKLPDLILMDVQMPIMDGLITTQIIRACETGSFCNEKIDALLLQILQISLAGKHIPIIAMTANALSRDRELCVAAGMDDYMTKPFIPEDVTHAISKIITMPQQTLYEIALDNLKKTYALEPEQLERLLKASADTLTESLTIAKQALDEPHPENLQNAAHKMKGTLLSLGLKTESELAEEIEMGVRQNPEKNCRVLVTDLERNLASIIKDKYEKI